MPRLVVALTRFPPSLVEKAIVSLETRPPFALVTVAVAVLWDDPLATIEAGESPTLTFVAGRGGGGGGGEGAVWVSSAWPSTLGMTELSVAVIVTDATAVEPVTVAV